MVAHLTLTLDASPPANPILLINGGALATGDRTVIAGLSTSSPDVAEMLLWGNVDPNANPLIQTTAEASSWQVYAPERIVRLAAGAGVKMVAARLRDDVRNQTGILFASIAYDPDLPVVTVTVPPDRTRISASGAVGSARFSWSASVDIDRYEVRVVSDMGAAYGSGVALGTSGGSLNVAGIGMLAAGSVVETIVAGSDLREASPGDGPKVVKIFARSALNAKWST